MATASTQPDTFQILDQRFVVQPGEHEFSRPAIIGVLARIPKLGRIARWELRGRFGDTNYGYASIPDDPLKKPHILHVSCDEVGSLAQSLEDGRAHSRPEVRLVPMEASALETEVAAFSKIYPALAHHLGLTQAKSVRVFDPGLVFRPCAINPKVGEILWETFRDRHLSGDFGTFGRYDPAPLDDPATTWMIGLQGQSVRNSHSIVKGVGLVRSEFPLDDRPGVSVTAVTALIPGSRSTFTMLGARRDPTV